MPVSPASPAGRNVLFFHDAALGDFVLTWPILLGIARTMAQCRVVAVVAGDKGRLAEQVLRVEHRDAEAGWPALHAPRGDLPDRPITLLANARRVVSLVSQPGSDWARNVARLAPRAEVTFLDPPPRNLTGRHAGQFLIDQLADDALLHAGAMGMRESLLKTGLMPKLHDPAGPVLLHPGSGSPTKNWPPDRWAALADRLVGTGRRVRLVAGEAEANLNVPGHDVQRPADLSELLFLLRGAGGYVGHDTGPTHLAAAVGLPTLALFGPTDPLVWQPLGPRVAVLRHKNLARLDVKEVAAALGDAYSARPAERANP